MEEGISPRYVEVKSFLDREDNEIIDWLMFATNQQHLLALVSDNRREWAIYYMLRNRRETMKKDTGWIARNHKPRLENSA